jgi:1-propanol dehydrogenase
LNGLRRRIMTEFKINTKVSFGENALESLRQLKIKKAFVVTDPFMVKCGAIKNVTDILEEMKVSYDLFEDIVPDPPIEKIVEGVSAFIKSDPDTVIVLGGGSAIDAAKAIKDFAIKIKGKGSVYFVAIPTTSGTGSEVTSFAVISDKSKAVKYPLVSDDLLPDMAILDPRLVVTVPKAITADTGMDVLTHAIEAYVSTQSSDFSDALAEKAIKMVFDNLLKAYSEGTNIEAREKMHNASCIAGMAFNNASLGLNHGLAHTLGAKFKIPHGRINSILLPHIIKFNANSNSYYEKEYSEAAERYGNISRMLHLSGSNTKVAVNNLVNAIVKLQKDMKMPTSLREQGVSKQDLDLYKEEIAKLALVDACTKTNPRNPSVEELVKLIENLY